MRILVSGPMSHVPGHLTSGSTDAFEELGHTVEVHDYLRFRNNPLFKILNRARTHVPKGSGPWNRAKRRELLRAVREFAPDLLFVVRGECYDSRTISEIGASGIKTVLWSPDDPYQHGTELVAAPAFDKVYVFDPHYLGALRERGVRDADCLPMACDPHVHRPIDVDEGERRTIGDGVCFVGTWYPNRERLLRAVREYSPDIWGGGWRLPLLRPRHPLKPLYRGYADGENMVRIYCNHRIVLNIQHPQSREAQNMRTFEAPACGALTFTERTSQLPELFVEDDEIVAYEGIPELKIKLEHYLTHPDDAVRVAEAGLERARADHSYTRRMDRVLAEAA